MNPEDSQPDDRVSDCGLTVPKQETRVLWVLLRGLLSAD